MYPYYWQWLMPATVIGSANVAWELLEKRGENYSSRPRSIVAYDSFILCVCVVNLLHITLFFGSHEILGKSMRGLPSPYNDYWRKWRKVGLSYLSLSHMHVSVPGL